MKALIVGGGIAGLAAAIALQKSGIDAHVYEQAPALKEIGTGLSLWANGIKALDMLGMGEAILDLASPIHETGTRTKHG